jgi:pimeloyl-ACP methyl ester carboxylesterase
LTLVPSRQAKCIASGPFFGANRSGAKVSQGMIDSFWLQGMRAGHRNTFDCIKAFSETDFTEDLKKFDVPTLIIHGDDDQIVPINLFEPDWAWALYLEKGATGVGQKRFAQFSVWAVASASDP